MEIPSPCRRASSPRWVSPWATRSRKARARIVVLEAESGRGSADNCQSPSAMSRRAPESPESQSRGRNRSGRADTRARSREAGPAQISTERRLPSSNARFLPSPVSGLKASHASPLVRRKARARAGASISVRRRPERARKGASARRTSSSATFARRSQRARARRSPAGFAEAGLRPLRLLEVGRGEHSAGFNKRAGCRPRTCTAQLAQRFPTSRSTTRRTSRELEEYPPESEADPRRRRRGVSHHAAHRSS